MRSVKVLIFAAFILGFSSLNAQIINGPGDKRDCLSCHKTGMPVNRPGQSIYPERPPQFSEIFNKREQPPADYHSYYAPLGKTNDEVFVPIGPEGGNIIDIISFPKNSDILYALTSNGKIYKTTDGGENWFSPFSGTVYGYSMDIDPNNSNIIYIGQYNYIRKSTDGGVSWDNKQISTEHYVYCYGIKVNENNSDIIYGYGYYYDYTENEDNICFLKSIDGGENWTVTTVLDTSYYLYVSKNYWAVDKSNYQNIYIATSYYDSLYHPFLFRSTDGGTTWQDLNISSDITSGYYVNCLDVNKNGNIILNFGGSGIYKSTDLGETWTKAASNDPNYLYSIKSYSGNPNIIVGGYSNSVYKSTDGGTNWTYYSNGLYGGIIYSIILNSETDYFAGNSSGVFKSTDGGQNWNRKISGMKNNNVYALDISKSDPDVIYSGVRGDGIYKSTDSGASWVKVYSLPNITSIAIDENSPDTAYATEDG